MQRQVTERRPHQRPSGGRELAGRRILANKLRRVAGSSKFGIARERLEQAGFGAEPQSKKNLISCLAEAADLLECLNLAESCKKQQVRYSPGAVRSLFCYVL